MKQIYLVGCAGLPPVAFVDFKEAKTVASSTGAFISAVPIIGTLPVWFDDMDYSKNSVEPVFEPDADEPTNEEGE